MIPFGPVPSRRLGRSLGINNIPPKICTYSCVYCQAGRTLKMQAERGEYYPVDRIIEEVGNKIEEVLAGGDTIDYLSFVPDGEPTLDKNLGKELEMLGRFGIKTAVITNASLVDREDVREDLMKADWVSVKVDAAREAVWRKINHPHRHLNLDSILQGILEFSKAYRGELCTETMLVKDMNDGEEHIEEIAGYISSLRPARAYLSIPTRPPAVDKIQSPAEEVITRSFLVFKEYLESVETLIGYEGNAFARTGNVREDILDITAVHPMREDAVRDLLDRSDADWGIVRSLIEEGKLAEINHTGRKFYVRKFDRKP